MTSAAALQAHYDEIQANMPVLPLAAAPRGYSDIDFSSLDPSTSSKVAHALQKTAAGVKQCQICSRSSTADGLGFKVSTRLDFVNRTVQATAGHFVCSMCRAVSSTSLLLELATPTLGSEDYARSQALQQLFLHFAAVNSAPGSITGNPEALAVWVQELACRAYNIQVVASSIRGWRLVGPAGAAVQQGQDGAGLQLLQQLLGTGQKGAAKPFAAAAGGGGHTNGPVSKPISNVSEMAAATAGEKQKQRKRNKGHKSSPAVDGEQQSEQPAAGVAPSHQQQIPMQQSRQPADLSLGSSKRKTASGDAGISVKKSKKHSAAAAAAGAHTPATPASATDVGQLAASAQKGSVHKKSKTPKVKSHGDRGVQGLAAAAAAAVPLKTPQPSRSKKAGKRRLSGPV